MQNPDLNSYTKPITYPKNSKKRRKQQPTENRKNDKTKYKLYGSTVFTFNLPRRRFSSVLVSYATVSDIFLFVLNQC